MISILRSSAGIATAAGVAGSVAEFAGVAAAAGAPVFAGVCCATQPAAAIANAQPVRKILLNKKNRLLRPMRRHS
jgi:hypothetical protein